MSEYSREYPRFALCGLNCGLCPNYHSTGKFQCPGCGGKDFYSIHPTCPIITCSKNHGGAEYCYQCEDYPCKKYTEKIEYDSFLSYRNVLSDFEKAQKYGIKAYQKELDKKVEILIWLLEECNCGRKKTFFCTAVNLLDLSDILLVQEKIKSTEKREMSKKEKEALTVQLFNEIAEAKNISLKLRRKK